MRVLAVLLVVAIVVSGCATGPDAKQWAGEVCTALEPWKSDIDELTAEANAAMKPDTSASQVRSDLLKLLAGAVDATETAREDIAAAGVPEVADGERIARRFTDSLAATADAYRTAHDDIEELESGASGFYDSVAEVMERLAADYHDVPQVAQLDSDELRDAFASVAQCRDADTNGLG